MLSAHKTHLLLQLHQLMHSHHLTTSKTIIHSLLAIIPESFSSTVNALPSILDISPLLQWFHTYFYASPVEGNQSNTNLYSNAREAAHLSPQFQYYTDQEDTSAEAAMKAITKQVYPSESLSSLMFAMVCRNIGIPCRVVKLLDVVSRRPLPPTQEERLLSDCDTASIRLIDVSRQDYITAMRIGTVGVMRWWVEVFASPQDTIRNQTAQDTKSIKSFEKNHARWIAVDPMTGKISCESMVASSWGSTKYLR